MSSTLGADQLQQVEALIDATLAAAVDEIEAVQAVERGTGDNRFWYVRMDGETKKHFSAEFTLGQRTLVVESYFMPEPQENREQVFEHLMVRNRNMYPLHFAVGSGQIAGGEPAIYLRAQVDNRNVDAECIDRLLAAVYECSEQCFVPAMRIGFESRFAERN